VAAPPYPLNPPLRAAKLRTEKSTSLGHNIALGGDKGAVCWLQYMELDTSTWQTVAIVHREYVRTQRGGYAVAPNNGAASPYNSTAVVCSDE